MARRTGNMFSLMFFAFQVFVFLAEIGENNSVLARKGKSRNRYQTRTANYGVRYRKGKPRLFSPLKNATVNLGRIAVFRCIITGSPSRIRWKQNGRHIPDTERYRTRLYSWGGVLRVRKVRISDYGTITCRAKNSFGHMTSNTAYLKIRGVNPKHKERCKRYNGKLCKKYVSARNIFIKFGRTQRDTERTIQGIFRRMTPYLSPTCKKHLLSSLCKHYFPPCERNAKRPKAIPLCKEDCLHLEKNVCQTAFMIVDAISTELRYLLPTCDHLPRRKRSSGHCQKLFSTEVISQVSRTSFETRNAENEELLRSLYKILLQVPQNVDTNSRRNADFAYGSKKKPALNTETAKQEFKGRCEPYVGNECLKYIRKGQLIFVSDNRTQQRYETKLNESLKEVLPFTSNKCKKYALKALCYYFFPPCLNDNRTPNLICRRDCELLEARTCSKEFQYAKTMPIGGEIIPECVNLPERQETCLELGVSDEIKSSDRCSFYWRYKHQGIPISQRPSPLVNASRLFRGRMYPNISLDSLPNHLMQRLRSLGLYNDSQSSIGSISNDSDNYVIQIKNKTLKELLNHSYMRTMTLPNLIRPDPEQKATAIMVHLTDSKSYDTELPLGTLQVYRPHKRLELSNVIFYYRSTVGYDAFVGRGDYTICGTKFDVEISRLKTHGVRVQGNSLGPVDVDKIELAFDMEKANERMLVMLKKYGFFLLRIMKPTVEMVIDKSLSVKFSGVSFVENFKKKATTEVFAGKLGKNSLFTCGLIFDDVKLGEFVSRFSGIYLSFLDLFQNNNGKNKIGLSMSANDVDITNVTFMAYTAEPLSSTFNTIIHKGFHFAALTGTPKNCPAHDDFCKLIQVVVGKDKEFLLGGETSWEWTDFKATIKNPAMSGYLPVEKVNIEVKGSNNTRFHVGVQPFIVYDVNGNVLQSDGNAKNIVFTGTLGYSKHGSQLEGSVRTDAVWTNAFGYPQLTVKRMSAGLSVRLTKPHFPNKLETRGDIEIGLGCGENVENECITGTVHIGMSDEISEQYFYGVMSRFTIQDIFRVHGVHSRLPPPIANIGFFEGLEISVAKQIHQLEKIGGPTITPGFTMKGKIRVLGLESDCSVNLKPDQFIVDAKIEGEKGPIKLGGVTPLYRSKRDRKHGPILYIETRFSPKPYVRAHIDGYTKLFGIFDEIRILMTQRLFMIRMVTNIFKSFKVRINVIANYSEDLSRTHFKARIRFIGGLARLTRTSSKHVLNILKSEKEKLQAARKAKFTARAKCQSERREVCDNCLKTPKCRVQLEMCRTKLNRNEKITDFGSSTSQFCVRMLRNNCKLSSLDCKLICTNMTRVTNSCRELEESESSLRQVKKSLEWVDQIKAMLTIGFFQVHSITFDTKLTPDDIGDIYVNAKLDVTIFERREKIDGMRLKFGQFARLASDVARYAVEWYRKKNI